jgi:small conductance mechanosensitive channel
MGVANAIPMIIVGVIFLLIGYGIVKFLRGILTGVIGKMPINKNIASVGIKIVYFLMLYILIISFLEIIGLGQIALALGGVIALLGLAAGMAMSGVLGDFVAGSFLMSDKDFAEGFVVETAGVKGVVESIDARKTRIRTEDGVLHVIPNKTVEGAAWKVYARTAPKKTETKEEKKAAAK